MSDNENFEALNPECKDSDVQSVKSTQSQKTTVLSAPTLNVPVTSGRQSPVHSDVDETGSIKPTRSSKRAQSPVRLPDELVLKARSQINRVKALTLHFKQIDNFRDKDSSAIKAILQSAEEVHRAFLKEHSFLEITWPVVHLNHEYFANDVYTQEASIICDIRQLAAVRLQPIDTHAPQSYREAVQPQPKLPKLPLPNFDGGYQHWTSFCSLFQSMVINNSTLTDLERLHYLRVAVTGPALELISHIPVTETAFSTTWTALKERYGNKRVLIDAQLAHLLQEHSATQKQKESAEFLQQLISGVDSALNALALIGQSTDNWDCLVVYSTIKQLSSRTRELWESSVSNQATYPTYTQLKDFISQRARTLENTESARQQSTASTSSNQQKPKSSLHPTARKTATQPAQQDSCYQCDCCFGAHFITSCQKFRTLSPQDRREVVIQRRICKNCMGRHNLASCKSSARCKICNRNHHSMLHEAATATSLPAATIKIEPRKFTDNQQ
ncbi:uncharacterized protein LOC125777630 [Bactrocera dorsalis]|uniref:Uncharacterized protein LOC125777630 n=1 Tax=Bactrocera dorsalis TaxID=27457 RepID=A0ABM3JHH4_BACDO|nr:uncharacterized protein LOC125777630 [Bactrocera dorsalis]